MMPDEPYWRNLDFHSPNSHVSFTDPSPPVILGQGDPRTWPSFGGPTGTGRFWAPGHSTGPWESCDVTVMSRIYVTRRVAEQTTVIIKIASAGEGPSRLVQIKLDFFFMCSNVLSKLSMFLFHVLQWRAPAQDPLSTLNIKLYYRTRG